MSFKNISAKHLKHGGIEMIKEIKEENTYKVFDGEKLLLIIESLGDDIYKATNNSTIIIGKIVPIDENYTELTLIENKKADKNGRYRKNKSLADHNLKWLWRTIEEKGFIRKTIPVK